MAGIEGREDYQRPEYHRSAPVDPVEKLVEQVGWEDALDQINANLEQHPDDQEARRRATLIVKLHDENEKVKLIKVKLIKDKLQH